MGVFNSTRQFSLPHDKIGAVADDVMAALREQGYEVQGQPLMGGGWDISVTRGGMFKTVLGLKTALKLSLSPRAPGLVFAEASVGIFGQQALPTVVMLFVAWPVLLTQIWGLIQQSKLDDRVMALIAEAIRRRCPEAALPAAGADRGSFCAQCGAPLGPGAKFCTACGAPVK